MIYISQLLGQKIWDAYGHPLGRLEDILVSATEKNVPPITALLVTKEKDHKEKIFVSSEAISSLWPSITLNVDQAQVKLHELKGSELLLRDRVLDQQIVDTEGKRVVRVNDLQIARKGNRFFLTGVDVSGLGLLRRLGLEKPGKTISRMLNLPDKSHVIPWEYVASIEHDDPLRLSVSQSRIVRMEPADIASVLDDLDHHTTKALLQGFTDEALADTLEESSAEMQVAVLSQLQPERAADVLEAMDPDEAADLLADLPNQTTEQLLTLMDDEDAEEVRSLLGYPEDTAGGIMTTEYSYVPDDITVEEAIAFLRTSEDAEEDEIMYYVYILDKKEKLQGVVSLRDLVKSPPDRPISYWKDEDPIAVNPQTKQEEVAYIVAKYDLLAVPVIDPDTRQMLGIVTVDDALDTVLPTAWKKKLPRFF